MASGSTYNDIETRKEEFRKYLETNGVIDALTRGLVGLYEESEKPGDALSFLQNFLQGSGPGSADIEDLKAENLELKAKNEALEAELAKLKEGTPAE